VFVRQGLVAASFEYPTGGREAVETAMRILQGKKFNKEIILDSRLFTRENVEKGGEVLTE